MANTTDKQIVLDGPRNAIVKLTGVLTAGDLNWTPAIQLSDFLGNDQKQTLVGFRIERVEYSIGSGIEMLLEWKGNTPQQITPMAGRGKIDAHFHGGWLPNRLNGGYDGSINLKSSGWMTGQQNFTVTLEMVKLYAG